MIENEIQNQRVFTQEEVNHIISDRLTKERKKYGDVDIDALKEKADRFDNMDIPTNEELQKKNDLIKTLETEIDRLNKSIELDTTRRRIATENDVPVELLTEKTVEELVIQGKTLRDYARKYYYPHVRDAGEPIIIKRMTPREQFAEAFKRALN